MKVMDITAMINTIGIMTEFFGWSSIINMGILVLSSMVLVFFRNGIATIHAKMFNVDEKEVRRIYLQYLAQYKIAIFMFNVVPYFALKIMS